MRDRDRDQALESAVEALTEVRGLHVAAARNLDDFRGKGYPSQSQMLSDIHKGRGAGDPTGDTATSERDLAGSFDVDRGHLDEWTESVLRVSGKLLRLVRAATVTASRDKVDAECELCARDSGFRSAVFAGGLCQWHYKFRRDWGVDPAAALTVLHVQGRRISHQKVREFHPDAVFHGEGDAA